MGAKLTYFMSRPFSVAGRRSVDVRYDVNELKNAGLIINTAEYCRVTASEV